MYRYYLTSFHPFPSISYPFLFPLPFIISPGPSNHVVHGQIVDNSNGSYKVTYTCQLSGTYSMEVTLVNTSTSTGGSTNNSNNNNNFTSSTSTSNGKHICGSPFIIQVDPGIYYIPLLSLSIYILTFYIRFRFVLINIPFIIIPTFS